MTSMKKTALPKVTSFDQWCGSLKAWSSLPNLGYLPNALKGQLMVPWRLDIFLLQNPASFPSLPNQVLTPKCPYWASCMLAPSQSLLQGEASLWQEPPLLVRSLLQTLEVFLKKNKHWDFIFTLYLLKMSQKDLCLQEDGIGILLPICPAKHS